MLCQALAKQAELAGAIKPDAKELAQRAQGMQSLLTSVQGSDGAEHLKDTKAARDALDTMHQRLQDCKELVRWVQKLGGGGASFSAKEKFERARSGLESALSSELQVAVLGDTRHIRGQIEAVLQSLQNWHIQQEASDEAIKDVMQSYGDALMQNLYSVRDEVVQQVQRQIGEVPTEQNMDPLRQELEELRASDDQQEEKYLKMVVAALNQSSRSSSVSQRQKAENVKPRAIQRSELQLEDVVVSGAFGHVLKGLWRGRSINAEAMQRCEAVGAALTGDRGIYPSACEAPTHSAALRRCP